MLEAKADGEVSWALLAYTTFEAGAFPSLLRLRRRAAKEQPRAGGASSPAVEASLAVADAVELECTSVRGSAQWCSLSWTSLSCVNRHFVGRFVFGLATVWPMGVPKSRRRSRGGVEKATPPGAQILSSPQAMVKMRMTGARPANGHQMRKRVRRRRVRRHLTTWESFQRRSL